MTATDVLAIDARILPPNSSHADPLHLLADALPQLVWLAKPDGIAEYFNSRWVEYTGISLEESLGNGWARLLHPEDLDRTQKCWQDAIHTGQLYDIEYRLLNTKDQSYRWFLGRGLPYRDSSGQIVRWFGTCTDIHDQKLAEEALRAAKAQSEAAARSRDEFLSILSHELRTPLSAIIGWVQLLQMGVLDQKEQKDALKTIDEQAKLQAQLVEDLLEVSRIINGKFRMRDEAVELHRTISSSIEAIRHSATQKHLTIDFADADTSVYVRGDAQRLQQMAWNLLSNAVKFTPDGGKICVQLHRAQSSARLVITDTGRGIAKEMLKIIFDRFQQSEMGANRPHGGLGLGLAIVQHIVTLHSGSIEAVSKGANQGSTFTVHLPIHAICPDPETLSQHPPQLATNSLQHKRLLVVDDDKSARQVVEAVLRNYGAEVTVASSATDAITILGSRAYDLLISDISMPVQNGYDLIRNVRQHHADFRNMPAIALSACASPDDQAAALDAGFNRHIAKPVEPQKLVLSILDLLERLAVK